MIALEDLAGKCLYVDDELGFVNLAASPGFARDVQSPIVVAAAMSNLRFTHP